MNSNQIVSKKRVADHGEVYTHSNEIEAMLELVKYETERIESRFLEPACGTGNFLLQILSRKLNLIETRYSKSQLDFERYSILAVTSIYGIDILKDNVVACQNRLLDLFINKYKLIYKDKIQEKCCKSIQYILRRNILHGDALTLKTIKNEDSNEEPIIFTEWSMVNGSMLKRRDFIYANLVEKSSHREMPLFSDLDEEAYIPEPVKDYPIIHIMDLDDE